MQVRSEEGNNTQRKATVGSEEQKAMQGQNMLKRVKG